MASIYTNQVWGIYLVVIFVAILFISSTECQRRRRRVCRADKDKYYDVRVRRCRACPNCPPGQTKNTSFNLTISVEFGALNCYPCDHCPAGSYSNFEDTQLICVKCSRNCTEEGRTTQTKCDGKKDAQCGSCLPMYYEWTSLRNIPCRKCTPQTTNFPACEMLTTATQSTTPRNKVSTIIAQETTTIANDQSHFTSLKKSLDSANMILVISVIIGSVCGVMFLGYKGWKLGRARCSRVNYGTTCTIESGITGSASSLQKPLMEGGMSSNDLEVDSEEIRSKGEERKPKISAEELRLLNENEKRILLLMPNIYIRIACRYMDIDADKLFDELNIDMATRFQAKKLQEGKSEFDQREFVFEVLKKWVRISGAEATLGSMYAALEKSGYIHVCSEIIKELDKRNRIDPGVS